MFLIPQSTIGKKIVVAITGILMLGFVVGHLIGNLQIFDGPEKLNAYAIFIKQTKPLLWGTRVVMLVSVMLHVMATVQLTRLNRASRPIPYENHQMLQAGVPSRFMIWSGIFLGAYIVYHLLHFTIGVAHQPFHDADVYANMVEGFSVWYISLVYILAMVSLGFHLNHGIYSVFQTLGLSHPKYNCWRKIFSIGTSVAIAAGYISIPVAVMMGFVTR